MMFRLFLIPVFAMALILGLAHAASAGDPLVFAVQEALTDEGYQAGLADGVMGPRTRDAIHAYETDFGLPVTGTVSRTLLYALGLAGFAAELRGEGAVEERQLAPIQLVPPVISRDAATDSDGQGGQNGQGRRQTLVTNTNTNSNTRELAAVSLPVVTNPAGQETVRAASNIPSMAARFAPRNWLISDLTNEGKPGAAAFGVFLEEGGSVAGPRFAERLRWQADGARFTMTYRNSVGQEIRRTGRLNGLNHMEGEAVGPDGAIWRWRAEAKPL